MNETPSSIARHRRRRRRQRIRIATYFVAGAAAWWFISHPTPFPAPPAPPLTVADSLPPVTLADTTANGVRPPIADSASGRDTTAGQPPRTRGSGLALPKAILPGGRLFRSIEARARAGERIAVSVTAYCLQGRTRRGNLVRDGIIAVDRKLFPLGREVDLFFGRTKYGRFLADDTGGVIRGGRIDVWMEDCQAARRFGRRRGYAQLVPRSP